MLWLDSDNVSGLESQLEKNKLGQLNDDVRYSIKTKSFSQMEQQFARREERLPEPQNKVEEKIYDITKVRLWRCWSGILLTFGSLLCTYLLTLKNIEPMLTVEWIWPPVGIRVRSLVSDGTK